MKTLKKILVVDDDPAVRRMLTLLFEKTVEVLLAATGEEALRIIAAQRPRLMLLDITMPGMSGLEVLTAARAVDPSMTVIMLTGKIDVELAKSALESGAVEFVTKPFDLNRLKDKVKRTLGLDSGEERSKSGAPWRVVAPESPAASGAPKEIK